MNPVDTGGVDRERALPLPVPRSAVANRPRASQHIEDIQSEMVESIQDARRHLGRGAAGRLGVEAVLVVLDFGPMLKILRQHRAHPWGLMMAGAALRMKSSL